MKKAKLAAKLATARERLEELETAEVVRRRAALAHARPIDVIVGRRSAR